MRKHLPVLVLFVLVLALPDLAAQNPGDRVILNSTNAQGVPVHPAAGDNSYVRWANGTIGSVLSIDSATGWIEVESASKRGWVTRAYVTVLPPDPDVDPSGPEVPTYGVATWNLEHFHDGATRGFPENTNGGPSYGTRTAADLNRIGTIIRTDLRAQILVLNEINGISNQTTSVEMDRLVAATGPAWQYQITRSGSTQRIAVMFDTQAVRLGTCHEIIVSAENLDGSDIFARDPLACSFTFLNTAGQNQNDVVVVGVHLASGQNKVSNHNRAMLVLRQRLAQLFANGTFSSGERDVLIAGDFNASRYDNRIEDFWANFDSGGFMFRTLSPDDDEHYPGTRLAGVPLYPRSQIDYVMGSARTGGIADELVQLEAEVHSHLLSDGFDDYREHVSDHLPVSVRVRVIADDD